MSLKELLQKFFLLLFRLFSGQNFAVYVWIKNNTTLSIKSRFFSQQNSYHYKLMPRPTDVTKDLLVADAHCRAIILNHKNHSAYYSCHRFNASLHFIMTGENQKKKVDILTSSQLDLKDLEFYDLCVSGKTTK